MGSNAKRKGLNSCRAPGCEAPSVGRSTLCAKHLQVKLGRERALRMKAEAAGRGKWAAWATELPELLEPESAQQNGARSETSAEQRTGEPESDKPPQEPPPDPARQPRNEQADSRTAAERSARRAEFRATLEARWPWLANARVWDPVERVLDRIDAEHEARAVRATEQLLDGDLSGLADLADMLGHGVRTTLDELARTTAEHAEAARAESQSKSRHGGVPPKNSSFVRAGVWAVVRQALERGQRAARRSGARALFSGARAAARDAVELGFEASRRAFTTLPDVLAAMADVRHAHPVDGLLDALGFARAGADTNRSGLLATLWRLGVLTPLSRVAPWALTLRLEGAEHLPRRGAALVLVATDAPRPLAAALVATALKPHARGRPVKILLESSAADLPRAHRALAWLGCVPREPNSEWQRGSVLVAAPFTSGTDTHFAGAENAATTREATRRRIAQARSHGVPILPCAARPITLDTTRAIPQTLRPWLEHAVHALPFGHEIHLGPPERLGPNDDALASLRLLEQGAQALLAAAIGS